MDKPQGRDAAGKGGIESPLVKAEARAIARISIRPVCSMAWLIGGGGLPLAGQRRFGRKGIASRRGSALSTTARHRRRRAPCRCLPYRSDGPLAAGTSRDRH